MARDKYAVVTFPDHKEVHKTSYVRAHERELKDRNGGYAESGFATKTRALQWAITGGWPNVTPTHPN